MLSLYTKEDTIRYRIYFAIGILFTVIETILIVRYVEIHDVLQILLAVVLGSTVLFYLTVLVSKRISKRLLAKLTETLQTLQGDSLRQEISQMEAFVKEHPKKLYLYAITLFSMSRIADGPEKSALYEKTAKESLIKRKVNRLQRANFTIELCYHYLMKNDIDMFLLAVKKLKTYHFTDFEKLSRKYGHLSEEHNPNEYKELAYIATLYTKGSDEEKTERLLNHPKRYYRLIYTYFIQQYFSSKQDQENIDKCTALLNEFEGDVYPLQRNDLNEF